MSRAKELSKLLSSSILLLLLALAAPAFSASNSSSVKARLNEDQLNLVKRAALAYLAREANAIQSEKDFSERIIANLLPDDRAEARKETSSLLPFAKARLDGDILIFERGEDRLKLQWVGFPEPRFKINGVDWIYNPRQALKPQINILIRRLELSQRSAMTEILLPHAHATVATAAKGLGLMLAGAVVGNGVSNFSGVVCWVASVNLLEASQCTKWKNTTDDVARLGAEQKSATVDIVEKQRANAEQDVAAWVGSREEQCPSRDSKDQNVYVADMIEVRFTQDGVKPQGEWFTIRMEFSDNGKPKSAMTVRRGVDVNAADAALKADNILKFDDQGLMTEISVPNPKYDRTDPGSPTMIPIQMTANNDVLLPDQIARREQMKSLVKSLNDWITICMRKDLIKKFLDQSEGKKPGAPVPAIAPKAVPAMQ